MMMRLRVIQGGKAAGKGVTAERKKRLFSAFSFGDLTRGDIVYYRVRFLWYCIERSRPPVAYGEAIADYEALDDRQKRSMEKSIDRSFSEEETEDLKAYLTQRYGMDLTAEEIVLPLRSASEFFDNGGSLVYDFLELSEKEGYSLDFKVWGYYSIENCLSSPSLENGVKYLRKALSLLGVPHPADGAELELVARELYGQEGLFVASRSNTP